MAQTKEVTVTQAQQLDQQNTDLLKLIISTGNVEQLERFMAAKEREEARQAAKEFDLHFAAMQSEFATIPKIASGYNYKYAKIEHIQASIAQVVANHGFSYYWDEQDIETGKRVTLFINGWGHTRSNHFDVPKMTGTTQMNPVQLMGTLSSYGKRYTITSGFGLILVDADTDAVAKVSEDEDETFRELMVKARKAKYAPKETAELEQRYAAMASSKSLPKLVKALHDELDARITRQEAIKKAESK